MEVKAPRKTAKCAAVVSIRWLHFVPFLLSIFVELGSDGLNFVGEAAAFYVGTADSSVCDRGAAALASLGGRGAASWGSPLGRGAGPEPGLVAALSFWLAGCGYGFCSSGPQFWRLDSIWGFCILTFWKLEISGIRDLGEIGAALVCFRSALWLGLRDGAPSQRVGVAAQLGCTRGAPSWLGVRCITRDSVLVSWLSARCAPVTVRERFGAGHVLHVGRLPPPTSGAHVPAGLMERGIRPFPAFCAARLC